MIYHIASMLAGFLMDLLLGDPYWLPHPIRLIGNSISFLEKRLLGSKTEEKHTTPEQEQRRGMLLVLAVLSSTVFVTAVLLLGAYRLHPYLGVVIESIMTYQILATKCLKVESMKVYQELKKGDIAASRKAVSMIVGRDTECLDETGVAKAAIETVAENTSDGVIAPMIFTAIGGPILGFFYKAVNTMDSMVGYKNDRYLYFGRTAAKLDDIVNYIPARISALLMVVSCFLCGKEFDGKRAWYIFKRDRYRHASPNSAQTEQCVQEPLGSGLREMQAILAKSWKSLISGMQKEQWRQKILSAQTGYCMRRLSCVKQSVCRYFGSSCLFLKLDDCETRKNLN